MSPQARMYALAGRTLANRSADACGIDREDNWKLYSDDYIADAIAALDAIGAYELLATLQLFNNDASIGCAASGVYTTAVNGRDLIQMRDAIAKATGVAA